MAFGKLLKEKMQLRNVKQSELASALGIPKTTLSSMINRDNMKVDIEILLKICDYLQCDPDDFYQDYVKTKKAPAPENKWEVLEKHLETLSDDELIELEEFVQFLTWKKDKKSRQDRQE